MPRITIPHIERRPRGDVKQLRIFGFAFYPSMRPGQRILKIMTDMFVKLGVLLRRYIALVACP